MDENVRTLIELIRVPGEAGKESAISAEVRRRLREMGVPAGNMVTDNAHQQSEYGGEIGNLIVRVPGTRPGPHRMLSTHLDTVPGAVGSEPRVDGERIVNAAAGKALGGDARCGVAILLAAARALMEMKGDHPSRTLCFFVQEEVGLVGSKALDVSLLGDPIPDEGYNFDGGDMEQIANKVVGTERMNIEVRGLAAHTGRAGQGISAAVIFAEALAELKREGWVGEVTRDGGWATSNIGIVRGGTGSNVTMPELYGLAECRSFGLDYRAKVLAAWRAAFEAAAARANQEARLRDVEPCAAVSFSQGPEYRPYELPADHATVVAAKRAIENVGREPVIFEHRGGMDTCNIVAKGIPAVGLGMGDRRAHSVEEWIDVNHFLDGCRVAIELATEGSD
jgi:tripeptide aminopeptidase